MLIKDNAAGGDEREHHDDASSETFEEEIRSFFIKLARKSYKKRSWHEDR